MSKDDYCYCPKCGTKVLLIDGDFTYCEKCNCQLLSQKDINFCLLCGKEIEKPGYLYYKGISTIALSIMFMLVKSEPELKKICKKCYLTSLENVTEGLGEDINDKLFDVLGVIGFIIGGYIGFILGGLILAFILGIIFAFLTAIGLSLCTHLIWSMIFEPGYREISSDKIDYVKEKYERSEKSDAPYSSSTYERKGSIISAILWMVILSILIGWIPLFGSLIAGYVGGKKAGSVSNAIIAVALPALLLAILIYTVFSSIPVVGALIAGAAFTIVIIYNLILLFGAVIGGARAGA